MIDSVVLLSIPALRQCDLQSMRRLNELTREGDSSELVPSFPAVTCPVQANMTTGALPQDHGVVANGSYSRQQQSVQMWTEPNSCIGREQLWDLMHKHDASLTSAVWFPLHSKQCGADYATPTSRRTRSGPGKATPGDCSTCTAMPRNGVPGPMAPRLHLEVRTGMTSRALVVR